MPGLIIAMTEEANETARSLLSDGIVAASYSKTSRELRVGDNRTAVPSVVEAIREAVLLVSPTEVVFYDALQSVEKDNNIHEEITTAALEGPLKCVVVESPTPSLRALSIACRTADALGAEWHIGETASGLHSVTIMMPSPRPTPSELLAQMGTMFPDIVGAKEMTEAIVSAITSRTPFSMVRLNHCEPRVIGYETLYSKQSVLDTFRMQWGLKDVPEIDIQTVQEMLIDSVMHADFLGVPKLRSTSKNLVTTLEYSVFALAKRMKLFDHQSHFVTVNTNLDLATSEKFFAALGNASKVLLISGVDVVDRLSFRLGPTAPPVEAIRLENEWRSTEKKLEERHYPEGFNRVVSEIVAKAGPGTVALVAAGILGKVFCHEVKKAGGIAIDMGSVFDAWRGANTRGAGFDPSFILPLPPKT